jgi:hypothetical protein
LIHIFENEWRENKIFIENVIKTSLNIYDDVVDVKECQFKEPLMLFYKNKLRYSLNIEKMDFNSVFIRFNVETSIYIENGLSYLLEALKRNYDGDIIISLDRRYESGKTYEKLGFKLI